MFEDDDDPLLRALGGGRYETRDYDPQGNFLRKLFGLTPTVPKDIGPLRSQETVEVTADAPAWDAPYPANIDEIYLGTKTAPPSGTHIPKHQPPAQVTRQWPDLFPVPQEQQEFDALYPYAKYIPEKISWGFDAPEIGGTTKWGNRGPEIDINRVGKANGYPTEEENRFDALAHESAHAAAGRQFPSRQEYLAKSLFNDERFPWWRWRVSGDKTPVQLDGQTRYRRSDAEQLARAVSAAAMKKWKASKKR
jgi:hypothetical protein